MASSKGANVSYVLFLLYPLIAVYSAIRNFRIPKSKNIAWLFIIYYGFTFVISDEHLDSRRYANDLSHMYSSELRDFDGFARLLYSSESNFVDIAQPLLTFVISRFTDNENILFAAFAFVFGYFYTRNIWFLLRFVEGRISVLALFFLMMAIFSIAFWQINGFRFWTAAHIFVYGVFTYSAGNRTKGILMTLSTVFVHFSFLLLLILFLIYLLVGNRLLLLSGLYLLSFFVSQVTPQIFSGYTSYLPTVFQTRTAKYTSEAYLERLEKDKEKPVNWYVNGRLQAVQYSVNIILLFVLFKFRKLLSGNHVDLSFIGFGLILGSFYNVFSEVPSMIRFLFIFFVFIFAFLFLLTQRAPNLRWPLWLRLPVALSIVLFVVVEVRIGFNTMGVLTVLGNPLAALFIDNETPLIELIR